MQTDIVLITPPFTQLNTPYPATAYLKGFCNTIDKSSFQTDLGIDVILELFTQQKIKEVFTIAGQCDDVSLNTQRMLALKDQYISKIDDVISFLQHQKPTLSHAICENDYLPEASRFEQIEDLEWSFGQMGTHNKARHLATLFLEDLGDLITEVIDPDFGFSRYAERIGLSATHFQPVEERINKKPSIVTSILLEKLDAIMKSHHPKMVAISIPFPGNLIGGFQCAKYIKENYPNTFITIGGGYPNTELRNITDSKPFKYIDAITLDDGEAPIQQLFEYLQSKNPKVLKRTFILQDDEVTFFDNLSIADIPQRLTGTPDYSDLPLKKYLSVIELANPMHSLWSDGRWNKLTLAHGCYWKKCTFCDISLDYIGRYEPLTAKLICDRIEELIKQTGENGFHFVDEAAPPVLLREVALEILRRKLTVVWWTNIRFEKSFTSDLCKLLKSSGCIAVSGGLEVASDRLLSLIQKGVTVKQVANVTANFAEAGILTHAYLMYGFPTQTEQETIDSLEMVRQLFSLGLINSAYWHQFAMTAHSPVGMAPNTFKVKQTGPDKGGFAYNDLQHSDNVDHQKFSKGLKTSLFNYMNGAGFDLPLSNWFDFKVPNTTIPYNYIENCLEVETEKKNPKVIWTGNTPVFYPENKEYGNLVFHNLKDDIVLLCTNETAKLISNLIEEITPEKPLQSFHNHEGILSIIPEIHLQKLKENGLLFL